MVERFGEPKAHRFVLRRRRHSTRMRWRIMMHIKRWSLTINFIICLLIFGVPFRLTASVADELADLRAMDQRIEDAVVQADLTFLESVYARDFRFTHGTGNVQSKDEWLKSVAKRGFLSRKVSLVEVELHGDVAVTYGRLDVAKSGEGGEKYSLRYVRVYERRNGRWEMLMHRTLDLIRQ
jgi:ketosteroid isomerase-like protein